LRAVQERSIERITSHLKAETPARERVRTYFAIAPFHGVPCCTYEGSGIRDITNAKLGEQANATWRQRFGERPP
jgi:hypothetical protein